MPYISSKQLCYINTNDIICNEKEMCSNTDALAREISLNGIFSPLCTVKQDDGYLLISEKNVLLAAKMLKMKKVPSIILSSDIDIDILRLIYEYFYGKNDIFRLIQLVNCLSQNYSATDLSLVSGISVCEIERIMTLSKLDESTVRALDTANLSTDFAKALLILQPDCRLSGAEIITSKNLDAYQAEKTFFNLNYKKPEKQHKTAEVKDVRFYVNSILKLADIIKSSGMGSLDKIKTEHGIDLTLHILQD